MFENYLKGEITKRVIDRRTRIKLSKTPTFITLLVDDMFAIGSQLKIHKIDI